MINLDLRSLKNDTNDDLCTIWKLPPRMAAAIVQH